MTDARWTASLVEARFEEAADTLRRLPPVLAKPMLCSWPTIIRDFWEALWLGRDPCPSRPAHRRRDHQDGRGA